MAEPGPERPPGAAAPAAEKEITVRNVVIATVCMVGLAFGTIMFITALGFTLIPMTKEFHWTRTQFSLAQTSTTWATAAVAPFMGRIIDWVGVKPIVLAATAIMGVVALTLSRETGSLPIFYASYAALGFCGASTLGYQKIVASLFKRNRGKMLAIFGVETSVSVAVLPIAIALVVNHYGWRGLYIFVGGVILCLLPVLYFLLEEPGRTAAAPGGAKAAPRMEGLTLGQILKTAPFWIMMTGSLLTMGLLSGIYVHMVPYLIQKGFSSTVAATYSSVAFLLGFAGSLTAGWLLDRWQTAKIASISYAIMALGFIALVSVTRGFGGFPLLYLTAALGGVSATSLGPMNTYFHTRFFGLRAFTEVIGLERTVIAVTAGIAAPLAGFIYDRTQNYNLMFGILIATSATACLLYLFIGRYRYAADVGLAALEPVEQPLFPAAAPAE